MTASLSSTRFPYLRVQVRVGTARYVDQEIDLEALVDTGFDGGVVVPARLIDPSIRPDTHLSWTLADGSHMRTPAYVATVRVGTLPAVMTVVIALGDEPLVGREVTDRFRVTFDHGREIIVEP
jgi:predicted aspartyl protease